MSIQTTEEKARAYDEAIERAKESYKVCGHDFDAELEYIFPELCESEDEGIRKELVNLVKSYGPVNAEPEKYSLMLAWLEKQKPAEWSEEDKELLEDAIHVVKTRDNAYGQETSKTQDWLKSLRPQKKCGYNPYKAVVESIAEMCRHYDKASHSALRDFYDNVKVKCKEAKEYDAKYPQKQWKPSEEQMKALKLARSFVTDDFSDNPTLSDVLKSLYNDLKQL